MNAQTEAARLLPILQRQCAQLGAEHGRPTLIPLSVYETDHDLQILRPEDRGAWTAAFHRQVMEILATALRDEGHNVRLVPLDAASYLRWLAAEKLPNNPGNRAKFISLQIQ